MDGAVGFIGHTWHCSGFIPDSAPRITHSWWGSDDHPSEILGIKPGARKVPFLLYYLSDPLKWILFKDAQFGAICYTASENYTAQG